MARLGSRETDFPTPTDPVESRRFPGRSGISIDLGEVLMRRYTSLLIVAFLLVLGTILGASLLSGHADRTPGHSDRRVTVYTTLPPEQAALLAAEYEKTAQVDVRFIPMSPADLSARLTRKETKQEADLVVADSRALCDGAVHGAFVPYFSEGTDSVAEAFKDEEGAWTGVWYDPVVFCMNSDYMHTLPRIPETWAELAAYPDMRLGMTDFLAADAAANLYFTLLSVYGEQEVLQWLSAMHPKVVQYVKFLSTPVRMAGMGEVDAAIAVQSETLRYLVGGYPLRVVYPTDGTSYLLTGAGLLRDDRPLAQEFFEWLLSDGAQMTLRRENVFFVPTNPGTLAYKQMTGKDVVLFDRPPVISEEQKSELLDRWLKNVRFK